MQATGHQWRMQDGDKGGLNNGDLGLELEINGDLRLSNRGQMKKSGSLGGCSPGSPPLDPPPLTCHFSCVVLLYIFLLIMIDSFYGDIVRYKR